MAEAVLSKANSPLNSARHITTFKEEVLVVILFGILQITGK